MHPLVRDLYRRFLHVGRDYPLGLEYVRRKAKEGILKNKDLTDGAAISKAVAVGRSLVQEMIGVIQLKKYRAMRHQYDAGTGGVSANDVAMSAAAKESTPARLQ